MKIKLIPLLLIPFILLSSCEKTAVTPDSADIVYSAPDTKGINTVMLLTSSGTVPISLVKDGRSALADDCYYYDLCSVIDADEAIKQKDFTGFNFKGENIGSVNLDKISADPYSTLATSGNWKLCPDIRYQNYRDSKKKADGGYSEYISKTFAAELSGKTPNITDIWEYDLDLDGTNEAIVRAADDGYTVLVLLSQSLGNSVLASDFTTDSFAAMPFFLDIDGNGTYCLAVLKGDKLKTVTVYTDNTLKPQYTVYLPLGA